VKRCAIYARYSSDLQSPTSIEDQQRLCRAYAERQGWAVVSVFEDAALSGFGIEHRPGYQQLLAVALSSPATLDVVLVEDLSRLTRDMAELMRLSSRLRLKGRELVGVSDGITTGGQGAKMHLAVKGLVNELYSGRPPRQDPPRAVGIRGSRSERRRTPLRLPDCPRDARGEA
jgi:DNA invertase Pin-like site-specific DNA recombinase